MVDPGRGCEEHIVRASVLRGAAPTFLSIARGLSHSDLGELRGRSGVERVGASAAGWGEDRDCFGVSGFPERPEANAFPCAREGPKNQIVWQGSIVGGMLT